MDKVKIRNKIVEILNEHFALKNQDYENGIELKSLDYDVDIVEILILSIELEDEFGIEISDEETDSFITFGDIIKCVENKIEEKENAVSEL